MGIDHPLYIPSITLKNSLPILNKIGVSEMNDIKVGDLIKVYDSCVQCDVTEPVVRIVNDSSYGMLIYSKRENWMGYDERLSQTRDIKEITQTTKTKKGE